MTRIATLEATNLKTASFKHDIGPVAVLVGSNYSGKSARLEAIRLGLLGYCPGLAKTNQGIWSLSCGPSMSVSLRLTDGTVIERSYTQKGDSIKASELVPAGFSVPPTLMDAGEYLRLSDRERVKLVFGLVDIGEHWSGERILVNLAGTDIDCDKELNEAVVLAKKAILDRLSESDLERHDNDDPIQSWLEKTTEDLRERIRNTTAGLGRLEKYSQASVELRATGNGVSAENVDRLLREKRLALQEASNALAIAKAKADEAKRNAALKAELERRLSEPFDANAIESTRKQITGLEAAQTERVDLGDLAFKVAEARGQLEAARNQHKNVLAELESLEAKHEMDLKAPKCPHCGTGGKKFKEAVKKQFEARNNELKESRFQADREIEHAKDAYRKAQVIYESAAIADKKAETDRLLIQSLKGELGRLETLVLNRNVWREQLGSLQAVEAPTDAEVFELNKTVARLMAEANDLDARQKRWVAQAHEAKRQSEAKAQRQSLEAELIALKAVVRSCEAIQSEMVTGAFSKILNDCNRFCDGILLSNLDYHDGEIGRWGPNHVWIPHRSWSGTEQLIGCAGISVALARQSPVKIVLLDELGRLQASNKRKLVERLLALTAEGFIDQCVAVDVDDAPYRDIPGLQLIEV